MSEQERKYFIIGLYEVLSEGYIRNNDEFDFDFFVDEILTDYCTISKEDKKMLEQWVFEKDCIVEV